MHQSTDADHTILATAGRALAALEGSLDGKPDDTPIQTDVRSLRGLADVMNGLRGPLSRCGGSDCFGHRAEGIRTWVRQESLAEQAARADAAEQRLRQLETALRHVAEATTLPEGQIDILWDWRGVADRAGSIARATLAPAAPPRP